ncbi:MAG: LemA family protein [Chromatiales bacterium]|nr:LemA family protein [Chromatiales bacterium]
MEWIFYTALGAVVVWAIVAFNLLVRDRHRVAQAWSDIDVQLKRRHDLIPKLIDALRAHTDFERSVQTELAELRARSERQQNPAERGATEGRLGERLGQLIAVAEAYPVLASSESFLHLQQQLTAVETDLQYARRYYNGAVNALNVRIDSFPDLLVARPFGFRPAELFQAEA